MDKKIRPLALSHLKLGEVKPLGWLRNQLLTQANGLSGHLDEFWPDIMDSGWIGGNAEGWERFPYWLDGTIPLAYLIESTILIQKLEKYISYILEHQQEDGWFGPIPKKSYQRYDPWPNIILCKALIQYFDVSKKERIIQAIIKYFHKLDEILEKSSLGASWAKFRWMDAVWGIHWLINYLENDQNETNFLLKLAEKLWNQGYDWKGHFEDFYYIFMKKDSKLKVLYGKELNLTNEVIQPLPKDKFRSWDLRSHVVNNAMGIKASTIWSRQSNLQSDKEGIFTAISTLDKYHGQATGMFSGDEHLAGKNPSQGTELCSVVEYLFSLEMAIPIVGCNSKGIDLIDRMEKICFNALPATLLADMWAHQYDQQVNQVQAKLVKEPIYTTNNVDSNIYGLEPEFGCCTANMHQGWPKFVEYGLWVKDEDGLVCLAYSPCKVSTKISSKNIEIPIEIEELTIYPFNDKIEFNIHLVNPELFSLKFRIPGWCTDPKIQINQESPILCKPGTFINISRNWNDKDKVILILSTDIKFERRFNNSLTIKRGSLIFSYNPMEEQKELDQKGKVYELKKNKSLNVPSQVKDMEIYPKSKWQYALVEPIEAKLIEIPKNIIKLDSFKSPNPPIILKVNAIEITNWDLYFEAAAPPPIKPIPASAQIEEIELIPYGCTNIRITEFPTIKKKEIK
jgi:hypothetical protein